MKHFIHKATRLSLRLFLLAGLLVNMLVASGAPHAQAAGFLVTNTADSGTGSLRQAILDANASTGADTITFDIAGVFATPQAITLASTLPSITDSAGLTIDGTGTDVTISGNNAVRVMTVASGASLTIQNLKIVNGNALNDGINPDSELGGGIFNSGTLTVIGSTFSGNNAMSDGGAIFSKFPGTVSVTSSTFSLNHANGDPFSGKGFGGAIYDQMTMTVTNSIFSDNTGAFGAAIYGGTLDLANSTFSNNIASFSGGAIYMEGTLTITGSTFSSNSADFGGALYSNASPMDVTNSTFSDNSVRYLGGAIHNEYGTLNLTASDFSANNAANGGSISNSGTLNVADSTFSSNSAENGGGIHNSGTLDMINSQVSANSGRYGGGIYNEGTLTMTDSNVSGNSTLSGGDGGGILTYGTSTFTNVTISSNYATDSGGLLNGGTATLINVTLAYNVGDDAGGITGVSGVVLSNTIVANNTDVNGNPSDCQGPVSSNGYNLDSDGSCGLTSMGDISNTDPLLGPLQDNGGSTLTHALLTGSPAIDAALDANCPAMDQRGVTRPQGPHCDIGAFELEQTLVYNFTGFFSPVDNSPTLNVAKAGQTIPLKWRVTDAGGIPVTDLTDVTVKVASLACVAGTAPDQVEEYATGASGLQNLGDGYYQFNWKTPKTYANSCKTLQLDLGDAVTHEALFKFTK